MKLKLFLILSLVLSTISLGFSQQKQAYKLYKANGKKAKYKHILKNAPKADVVLFGEFHNNPISHWLQLELLQDLKKKNIALRLGAEMFEADNQEVLNKYLNDEINSKQLSENARLWSNYSTDYKPLVEFAKQHKLAFVATNIPRRYASKIYKERGFKALDSLSEQEKSWIAPMPIPFDIELKTYKDMLTMMGSHATEDIVKAQAIKDATMAHFIIQNLEKNSLFIHFNGSYHSNYYEGIYWYLKTYKKNIEIITITTVEQDDINKLEEMYENAADYIICVPTTMTKTY